jgi:hypothetical protein
MNKPQAYVLLLFILPILGISSAAPSDRELSLLYFFSPSCVHCSAAAPTIRNISREFTVHGLVYGKGEPEPMPFEVRKGDKADSAPYGLRGVPALVVLNKDAVKATFQGESDIKDCVLMLKAFKEGALTTSEAIASGPGSELILTGWLVSRGEYFKNAHFMITDRKQSVRVRPWLPLEAVRSPFRKARPRLMSDVVDKPVALRGSLVKKEQGMEFIVKEETSMEIK